MSVDPALMAPVSSPMPPSESPSGNSATVSTPLDQIMLSLESLASGPYSKALFITIAVGCSLLVVNILVFAGTYYQHRTESDHHQKNRKTQHRVSHAIERPLAIDEHLFLRYIAFFNGDRVQPYGSRLSDE